MNSIKRLRARSIGNVSIFDPYFLLIENDRNGYRGGDRHRDRDM